MSTADDQLLAEDMVEAARLLDEEAQRAEGDPEPWPSGHSESLCLAAEATRGVARLLRTAASHRPIYSTLEGGPGAFGCARCGPDGLGACAVWDEGVTISRVVLEGYS